MKFSAFALAAIYIGSIIASFAIGLVLNMEVTVIQVKQKPEIKNIYRIVRVTESELHYNGKLDYAYKAQHIDEEFSVGFIETFATVQKFHVGDLVEYNHYQSPVGKTTDADSWSLVG